MYQYGGSQGLQCNIISNEQKPDILPKQVDYMGCVNCYSRCKYIILQDATHHGLLLLPDMGGSFTPNEYGVEGTVWDEVLCKNSLCIIICSI